MTWFQTLKDAKNLDIVKELVKVICKTIPGISLVADFIEGYENLEDKEVKAKTEEILKTIATDGKEILASVKFMQGENLQEKLSNLAQIPGMQAKFDNLGQSLAGDIDGLKKIMEKGFVSLEKMLSDIRAEIQSFKKSKHLSSKASLTDSLTILPQEIDKVKAFLLSLRKISYSQVDAKIKNEMGTLVSAVGDCSEAEELYREALEQSQTLQEKSLIEHNRFQNFLQSKDFGKALETYKSYVSLGEWNIESELFPIAQYHPLEILGVGGFGVAFHCQEITGREVVIKAVLTISDEEAVIREAALLQQIKSPYIIEILAYGFVNWKQKKNPYLVMNYFPGKNLQTWLDEKSIFSVERTIEIAFAIAEGMQSVHARNIIHRDLKPSNLLYQEHQHGFELKIIDFGLAMRGKFLANQQLSLRSKADKSVIEKDIAGTLMYAPPEQLGEIATPVGTYSDVYSFGIVMNTLLFRQTKPTPKMIRDFSNQALIDLISECQEYEPQNRISDFTQVLERLNAINPGKRKQVEAEEKRRQEEKRKQEDAERKVLAEAEEKRRQEEKRKQEDAERKALAEAEEKRRQEEKRKQEDAERKVLAEAEEKWRQEEKRKQEDAEKISIYTKITKKNIRRKEKVEAAKKRKVEIKKAIEDYTKVIENDSQNVDAYYNRGNAFQNVGEYSKAVEDYNKAIEIDPQNIVVYCSLGKMFRRINEFDKAREIFRKARQINPKDENINKELMITSIRMKKNKKIVKDCTNAIEIDPKNADIYYKLGNAFERMKRFSEAIANYNKAMEIDPSRKGKLEPIVQKLCNYGLGNY